MPVLSTLTAATGTLTAAGNAANTETVTIGGKVYTFQTSLTDVDGNVLIGASASDSLDNLIAAINLGTGAGTLYATSMTENAHASAAVGAGDTMVVTAKVAGLIGNFIDTTETGTQLSWGAATLASGAGNIYTALNEIVDEAQLNSDVIAAFRSILGNEYVEAS